MKPEFDSFYVEESVRETPLAKRVIARLAPAISPQFMTDARVAIRPDRSAPDPFTSGKRRLVIMRKRSAFVMACPASSSEFACCGYLVMNLASNCPMDCSYCFLQEYVADNPAFQLYANYADAFAELDELQARSPERHFRIGTGEIADSLAFDSVTELSIDLIRYFSRSQRLTLELKTKTNEIDNLLRIDPRGRVLVSWTLSPDAVFRGSEHRTASPSARIAAAAHVLEAGFRVGFHLDPIIAYDSAESDYLALLDQLFDTIAPARISFVSMGGLRMTPGLRAAARKRFPRDPMLAGEDVLSRDGRFRAFAALRLRLYSVLRERIARADKTLASYLCMETPSVVQKIYGQTPLHPSRAGELLATR